ncbi:MAG: glycosyltransferase, partial [Ardenticatenia bacterium]|nr:glycosyltransferase [Ardenticatenia bacterium]
YVPETVERWRRRLGLFPKQHVIMYVGTLSLTNHPVDLLIDAFALLSSRGLRAHLVLVGGGPDLEPLRRYAVERGVIGQTAFVGRIPFSEVPALLRLATVTVDPVHDDVVARARWPLKIAESLVAGVPVVTSDVGDRHDMLGKGAAGILVPPGDKGALADGIASVLNDLGRLTQLRKVAKEVGKRFLNDDVIDHLIGFYRGEA